MKVIGVIPSRYDSRRFPGKPLIDLDGKSMIQRVYEGVMRSSKIHQVIVASDDQRIVDEVESLGKCNDDLFKSCFRNRALY